MKSHGIHVYGIFAQQRKQMSQHFKIEKATSSNIPSFDFLKSFHLSWWCICMFFFYSPPTRPLPTHLSHPTTPHTPGHWKARHRQWGRGCGAQTRLLPRLAKVHRAQPLVRWIFFPEEKGVQLTQIEKSGKTYIKICERRKCGNTTSTKTASLPLKIDVWDRWFRSLLVQPRPIFGGENVSATRRVSMHFHENRCGNVYEAVVIITSYVLILGHGGKSSHAY